MFDTGTGTTLAPTPSPKPTNIFDHEPHLVTTFYGIADVPYNERDADELLFQITSLPNDAQFLVHLGDIKSSSIPCSPDYYKKVGDILRLSSVPVFIIPGDNEWNDCESPDEASITWDNEFGHFDSFWQHNFTVFRQPDREENFAFINNRTLFIGVNLVNGLVRDPDEWTSRLTAQFDWTKNVINDNANTLLALVIFGHSVQTPKNNAFFEPLKTFLRDSWPSMPLLFLQGDTHRWSRQMLWLNLKNGLRVSLTGGTSEPPVKITISPSLTTPSIQTFQLDRRH
jgi:hypothetical protein